jgi:hypothetical protein
MLRNLARLPRPVIFRDGNPKYSGQKRAEQKLFQALDDLLIIESPLTQSGYDDGSAINPRNGTR